MVAELSNSDLAYKTRCSLAKISMVAEPLIEFGNMSLCCSLAKISMVAERRGYRTSSVDSCSLAKISMVAEQLIMLRKWL